MKITRLNSYRDPRFSQKVLWQHGAFLINEEIPCAVEIVGNASAVVRGGDPCAQREVIDAFRFFAGHITHFYDERGHLLQAFPPLPLFPVRLADIQPSQFYIDGEKLRAVASFVRTPADIIIPLASYGQRYAALDGHTRLYLAQKAGYEQVWGFFSPADASTFQFVAEAQRRGVDTPADLQQLSHADYVAKWYGFCEKILKNCPAE